MSTVVTTPPPNAAGLPDDLGVPKQMVAEHAPMVLRFREIGFPCGYIET
jgi:hypothetical protein